MLPNTMPSPSLTILQNDGLSYSLRTVCLLAAAGAPLRVWNRQHSGGVQRRAPAGGEGEPICNYMMLMKSRTNDDDESK